MGSNWVYDVESFYDFLGFVAQCAPDFPEEDFLDADQQLDLEQAFRELRNGLGFVQNSVSESQFRRAEQLLGTAFDAFQNGDEIKGSHTLQEVDRELFKKQ